MKAFVSAQLTEDGLKQLSKYAEYKLGGWGYTGKKLVPEELVKEAADCDIMIICYEDINEYVLKKLPKLKFIACSRGGIENIDREAVRHSNVLVSSAPGRNANAVAELTMGLAICAMRHIAKTHHLIMSRKWEQVPWDIAGNTPHKTFDGSELQGKTLGLVGYGAIAHKVAGFARAFGMSILAYDPFLKQWPTDGSVESVDFESMLKASDIVSLHCKLSDNTKNMINKDALSMMKKSAVLVNTARGALVDEDALYHALYNREIACAALDTQVNEPMPHDHPFLTLDNIILTPHIGGASHDIVAQQTRIIMEDVVSFFETGRPVHVVA